MNLKLKILFSYLFKFIFLFILLFTGLVAKADSTIPGVFSFSIGSVSASIAENPDKLVATDGNTSSVTSTPYTGAASSLPLDVMYEHFPNLKRSFFIRGVGPLLASTADRYFSGSIGINFYFGQVGTNASIRDFNFEMKLIPKLRYYAGPALGLGYIVYNTKSETKNDTLLEIGGQAGVLYSLNPRWGLRAELGAARATGVLISSTIIKILLGTTYNIGN